MSILDNFKYFNSNSNSALAKLSFVNRFIDEEGKYIARENRAVSNLARFDYLPKMPLCQDPGTSTQAWAWPIKKIIDSDVERIAFNNEQFVNVITIDLDRRAARQVAWDEIGLPPSLSVINKKNSRSRRAGRHDSYFLKKPVYVGRLTKAVRFESLVRRALTFELGGDPRFSNRLTKSPWHSKHHVTTPAHQGKIRLYTLEEIAEKIDIERYLELHKNVPAATQLDDGSRNCSLFDSARLFAYDMMRNSAFDAKKLVEHVEMLNAEFVEPLRVSDTRSIARSIEKFCREKYRGSDERSREKQAERGRLSGAVRRAEADERGTEYNARHDAGESWSEIAESVGKARDAVKQAALRARRRAE